MKTHQLFMTGAFGLLLAIAISSCSTAGNNSAPSATAAPTPGAPPAEAGSETSAPATPQKSAAAAVQAPLADDYNPQGIYPDGVAFSGGVDGDGFACSSNLLGNTLTWNGVKFDLGSASQTNVISCEGQTISLPAGNYSKLKMLAIGVNGAQADLSFTVHYSDDSTQSFKQSISDWASPDSNTGESTAMTMDYRLQTDGSHDENTYYLFGYSFDLKSGGTVKSLQLPD